MIANDNRIFKRLADIRQDKDLNQYQVAHFLGVNQATYSKWETGKEIIPLPMLHKFCMLMKCSMDYALGFQKENSPLLHVSANLDKKEIGKRLIEFRDENQLTQLQLAQILNTTQSTISAYENGKTMILTAFVYQIARKYGVSTDYLCAREKSKEAVIQ